MIEVSRASEHRLGEDWGEQQGGTSRGAVGKMKVDALPQNRPKNLSQIRFFSNIFLDGAARHRTKQQSINWERIGAVEGVVENE